MKDDKYYIERVLQGNVNAFSSLVDKHKGLVYTIALRMLKNPEDAEELAQDTFVKAFNSLKDFKFESKFSTWLYRITYNGAISKLRKKQIEIADIENDNLPEQEVLSSYNAINELKRNEQKLYINLAIEQLKDDDALLITMYYLQESSIEEISEITLLSISNVKVKLHRARKRFYDELKGILKEEVKAIL
ncbi:MAG: sigma-70 family RNA polymerase sigma factor [Bacteroidales bacterium]|nr:sigma-70 family RNA polymerase sigma factor [Bacteroidales bacterium]